MTPAEKALTIAQRKSRSSTGGTARSLHGSVSFLAATRVDITAGPATGTTSSRFRHEQTFPTLAYRNRADAPVRELRAYKDASPVRDGKVGRHVRGAAATSRSRSAMPRPVTRHRPGTGTVLPRSASLRRVALVDGHARARRNALIPPASCARFWWRKPNSASASCAR